MTGNNPEIKDRVNSAPSIEASADSSPQLAWQKIAAIGATVAMLGGGAYAVFGGEEKPAETTTTVTTQTNEQGEVVSRTTVTEEQFTESFDEEEPATTIEQDSSEREYSIPRQSAIQGWRVQSEIINNGETENPLVANYIDNVIESAQQKMNREAEDETISTISNSIYLYDNGEQIISVENPLVVGFRIDQTDGKIKWAWDASRTDQEFDSYSVIFNDGAEWQHFAIIDSEAYWFSQENASLTGIFKQNWQQPISISETTLVGSSIEGYEFANGLAIEKTPNYFDSLTEAWNHIEKDYPQLDPVMLTDLSSINS